MRTIGIVCNKNKPQAHELLAEVAAYLREKKIVVLDDLHDSINDIIERADLLVALGGDGTILSLANHLAGKGTPVLGVNLGRLGFITDVKVAEVYRELDVIMRGDFAVESRFMLEVMVKTKDGERSFAALNDVVIHREGLSRYLNISLRINGDDIYSVGGDGIIIATPTGSTGYNLSAGGPIVHSRAENIIVTPICHHSLIQKSIVLSNRDTVSLSMQYKNEEDGAHVIIDGQKFTEVYESDSVTVTDAGKRFMIVRNSSRNYFDVLKEKFGWAQ